MRLSRTVRALMIMNGNKNAPAKPLSKEAKERERKDRNKRKAASKIVYRFDQPEKATKKPAAVISNIFWWGETNGVFSVFKANASIDNKVPVRKYKIKKLAMGFCRKANSKA